MGQNFSDVCRTLAEYHCPRYEELPHIALYKDQVVSVLNEAVGPFYPQGETPVTATMVNNYVKMKLLAPPEKKKYSTGQIAYLYVIFLLKQVLSIGEIAALLRMQQRGWYGDQGFYEAADFTAGAQETLVYSHMAHHQGMILCAICNALCGDYLPRVLQSLPRAAAHLPLLCEMPPRHPGARAAGCRARRAFPHARRKGRSARCADALRRRLHHADLRDRTQRAVSRRYTAYTL